MQGEPADALDPDVVNRFNFGVVQVQPTGSGAEISAVLAHEGNAFALGLDLKDLI